MSCFSEISGMSISIHSLRMEGDASSTHFSGRQKNFNPLPPHGGRPGRCWKSCHTFYFNPLPPHGGRPYWTAFFRRISHFNPLPPHGGRLLHISTRVMVSSFQSTPSAWRETLNSWAGELHRKHFNPLPPHGGRQFVRPFFPGGDYISIHSLRMEGDIPQTAQSH